MSFGLHLDHQRRFPSSGPIGPSNAVNTNSKPANLKKRECTTYLASSQITSSGSEEGVPDNAPIAVIPPCIKSLQLHHMYLHRLSATNRVLHGQRIPPTEPKPTKFTSA